MCNSRRHRRRLGRGGELAFQPLWPSCCSGPMTAPRRPVSHDGCRAENGRTLRSGPRQPLRKTLPLSLLRQSRFGHQRLADVRMLLHRVEPVLPARLELQYAPPDLMSQALSRGRVFTRGGA